MLAQHVSMPETDDAQGTGFWLVVVDQFERKGIACEEAFAKAAQIITSAQNIRNLRVLEMSERGLKTVKRVVKIPGAAAIAQSSAQTSNQAQTFRASGGDR